MLTTESPADTLRRALQRLKRDVADGVRASVARFEAETQLTVRAIDVDFELVDVRASSADAPRELASLLRRVHVRLAELDADDTRD